MQSKPVLAITMGDPAGVGAEVAVKALLTPELYNRCRPVVVGDYAPIADAIKITGSSARIHTVTSASEANHGPDNICLIDMGIIAEGGWRYGELSSQSGDAGFRYIEKAIDLALKGEASGVVTCPINKTSLNMGGHHYSGHTEIFARLTGADEYAMLLTTPSLNVIHVTTHVSMREACKRISSERVYSVIRLAQRAMELLGVPGARIAVAGLNPHCSENGLFGGEEEKAIIPAVERARRDGLPVSGPVSADTVFTKAIAGLYDIVVAMYHDQGHIPVKLCGFKMDPETHKYTSVSGVNITAGLPIIRTSVDHGTAYDIAGRGVASGDSLIDAIDKAATMAINLRR